MPNVSGVVMGAADSTRRTTPGSFLGKFQKNNNGAPQASAPRQSRT